MSDRHHFDETFYLDMIESVEDRERFEETIEVIMAGPPYDTMPSEMRRALRCLFACISMLGSRYGDGERYGDGDVLEGVSTLLSAGDNYFCLRGIAEDLHDHAMGDVVAKIDPAHARVLIETWGPILHPSLREMLVIKGRGEGN